MSWSYRVVKIVTKIPLGDTDISYSIHSVYTDENGDIVNISENPTYPISDDLDGLKDVLSKMIESCNKPVIDYHTGEEIVDKKWEKIPKAPQSRNSETRLSHKKAKK